MGRARSIELRVREKRYAFAVGVLVGLGGLLRFGTLGLQSYRYDEAVTVARVLHPSLFDTLATVPGSESTPPLYYALAWGWSRLFGTGEIGLRSLSAIAGTATIAIVYLAGSTLVSRRAGVIAAAIVAVSPVMVWFSQDARAYALVVLLVALSLLFFARTLRDPTPRNVAAWSICSALALATHYFAFFVVGPEAILLLRLAGAPRRVLVGIAGLTVVGILLLPIAIQQVGSNHADWIAQGSLSQRLERSAAKLAGSDNGDVHGPPLSGPIPLVLPLAIGLAGLGLLFARGPPTQRRGAVIAAIIGVTGVSVPLLLAALGHDYFEGRNLMPVYLPLILLLGAGFGAVRFPRAGPALAAAFCLCSLVYTLEIDRLPRLQREDLRNAAEQIGPPRGPTAVVTIRHAANWPVTHYLGLVPSRRDHLRLREIVLLGSGSAIDQNRHMLPGPFRLVGEKGVSYDFTMARLRAPHLVNVPTRILDRGALVGSGYRASVLVRPSAGD